MKLNSFLPILAVMTLILILAVGITYFSPSGFRATGEAVEEIQPESHPESPGSSVIFPPTGVIENITSNGSNKTSLFNMG